MEKVLFFLFIVLSGPSTGSAKKLKRIEDRITRIEARQDADSMTRREDILDLSQRLDDVENWLNSSLADLSLPGESAEAGMDPRAIDPEVDISLKDDMLRVKSAFADEKARWRRQASDMEHSIQAVQNDLSLEIQSLVTTVKNEVASQGNKILKVLELKEKLTSETQSSINDVKYEVENIRDTLDALQFIIQDNATSCLPSHEILDKLNKIEKKLDDHISSVNRVDHTSSGKPDNQTSSVNPTYSSCQEIYRSGEYVSGAYDIVLAANSEPIRVYCDMTTDGGGWTVFQRRQDGSEDFFRGWDDYASGFGIVEREFWLGNDYISQMTSDCCHELRVDMEDFAGSSAYAKFKSFKVFPKSDDYKMEVGNYSGNASDSLRYHSGRSFTTKDKDNDINPRTNCAQEYKGAWWYSSCFHSNLNGLFLDVNYSDEGMIWFWWKNSHSPLKKTEMKFRKT